MSHINSVLKKKGYIVKKNELTSSQIYKIKKQLKVRPFVNPQFAMQAKSFPVYLENTNKFYLPRYWGIKEFGEPMKDKLTLGEEIDVSFVKELRDYQKPIVNAMMVAAKEKGGGLICVGCGLGKTVISINILSQLKRKTLVIVHKEFLMNQWKDRINEFLDGARIGKIQGKTIDIHNKDIVIGMLQSISMKDYLPTVFESFGTVIFDECHHLGAEVFSKALPKVASKYMIGLSATPKRSDGLTKVFEWYIGDIVYSSDKNQSKKDDVNVRLIKYKNHSKDYGKEVLNYKGMVNIPRMITNICSFEERSIFIIKIIKELVLEDRKILLLSDRRAQLNYFKEYLDSNDICSSGFYVGGMKQKELKNSEEAQILLATYSMASEGFDVPSLNTLILASPKSSIEQSIGRILRQRPETRKKIPLVIDIVDNFSVFSRQGDKRRRYYKRNKYDISFETSNDDTETTH